MQIDATVQYGCVHGDGDSQKSHESAEDGMIEPCDGIQDDNQELHSEPVNIMLHTCKKHLDWRFCNIKI